MKGNLIDDILFITIKMAILIKQKLIIRKTT